MEQQLSYLGKIKEWLVVNGADLIVDLIVVLVILVVGRIVIDWLCNALRSSLQRTKRVSELLESFFVNVANKVLWVVLIMIAIQRLGIEIGPLVAGLGVTGFIVGFAFQESLGNLAAGMMIALNEPFTVGDFVEVAGKSGVVKEMNMMATTIFTPDNKKIVVPNNTLWGSCITNYTALDTRRVDLVVGVSYSSDIGKAKQVIQDALKQQDLVLDEPAPTVEVTEMADSSVNLVVRPWCTTATYWGTYFAVNQAVKEALDNAGVEIPFPQRDVHLIPAEGMPAPMPQA